MILNIKYYSSHSLHTRILEKISQNYALLFGEYICYENTSVCYINELFILLVIRSVSDVLRAQSRFVKCVGGEAAGRTPYTFYKPTLGPKYVSNRPCNEFITPTTFI